ncbi:MAG TPA: hypothetical protein VFL73_08925 [Solirubrobacteraceae bacterium]|jgi:hypothetical protein|nr:hypothetical protein [Solirubrobacteraceae bacterium]
MNGLMLRVRALGRRSHLDAELAAGADPSRDPALELRARQLTGASTRAAIASTIHHLLEAAEEPPAAWGSQGPRPPLQREAILNARADLLAIADRLTGPAAVTARAAALAAQLVWDAGSPIYADTGLSLADCTRAVLTGLPLERAA